MDASRETGVKTLVDAVDFEIGLLREENQASGWTTRAILLALAGLLWLFLDQLRTPVSALTVVRTFFVLSVALDLLLGGATSIAGKVEPGRPGSRWISSRDFLDVSLPGRLDLSLAIILYFLYLWIALRYWPDVTRVTTAVAFMYFALLIPILVLFLVGLFFDIDLPRDQDKRTWSVFLGWIYLGLGLWLVVSYARTLLSATPPSHTEWKIAGTLIAIRVLVSLLARMTRRPILLQELVTLRRDIVFERTDPARALHHLDIIVAGMQEGDRLQRKVEKVMALLREHHMECRAMIDESADMQATLAKPQGSGESRITRESLKNWYKGHHAILAARVERITLEVAKSYRGARLITKGSPSAQAMWKEIDAQVNREFNSARRQSDEMGNSVEALTRELLRREQTTTPIPASPAETPEK